MCALHKQGISYSDTTTGFEKKTNGIANGPTSSEIINQYFLLALRNLAT